MHAKCICTSRMLAVVILGGFGGFWRAKEPINQKRHARVHVDEKPNPIVIHQLLSEKGRCKVLTLKTWENGSLPLAFILHHHKYYDCFTYRYPHLGSRTNYGPNKK